MKQPGIISRRITAFTVWIAELFVKVIIAQAAQFAVSSFSFVTNSLDVTSKYVTYVRQSTSEL
jgi:hypothetical protein